jgi:hypothetical protein
LFINQSSSSKQLFSRSTRSSESSSVLKHKVMSDKKQSGKPENKSDQRYKPWLRKAGRGGGQGREQQAIKKKDPEQLPILTFGPNNNFAKLGGFGKQGTTRVW